MEVDVTGAVCPRPMLIVRRCLEELESGDDLTVTGDYPPAERNIRRSCYKHGFEVRGEAVEEENDTFTLHITVTEESTLDRPA